MVAITYSMLVIVVYFIKIVHTIYVLLKLFPVLLDEDKSMKVFVLHVYFICIEMCRNYVKLFYQEML